MPGGGPLTLRAGGEEGMAGGTLKDGVAGFSWRVSDASVSKAGVVRSTANTC